MLRLTQEQEEILVRAVEQHKSARKPFKIAARHLPYSSRQLNHYYRSHLNPELSHHDLGEDEKYFIDEFLINRTGQRIEWKTLRFALKERHGSLRSENKVKNYWYSKQKQNQQKQKAEAEQRNESCPSIRDVTSSINSNNHNGTTAIVTPKHPFLLPSPVTQRPFAFPIPSTPLPFVLPSPCNDVMCQQNHRVLSTLQPEFKPDNPTLLFRE